MMTIPMDNNLDIQSRERVQRLFNKNVELESKRRRSAQARISFDPNAWQQMQENYEAIILEDNAFSEQHEIEYALWQLHYRRIEELRAHFSAALASSASNTSQSLKGSARPDRIGKIRAQFKTFLSEATGFYHDLMLKIRAKYGLPLGYFSEDKDNQIVMSKDGNKSADIKKGMISCHRCLIYLGDLARYKGLYGDGDSKARDYAAASSYYMEASSLWPSSGNPHHQLAILASYSGDELVTVYRYFRSLAVDNPFSTARENLTIAFEKNRQSYSQLLGDAKASSVIAPVRMNGKGRGKAEARTPLKNNKKEVSSVKERASIVRETFKAFRIRFVRLNGILFTRTSLETFEEVYSMAKGNLLELLSSGPEEEHNFGSGAAENRLMTVRLIAILIFAVHNVNRETENQSYAEILQRSVLLQNIFTVIFEFMGCILERCLQLHDPCASFLLPGVLVFLEWLACHPDIAVGNEVEEKQATARTFFWNHCISFLNNLLSSGFTSSNEDQDEICFFNMSKYEEGETANRLALWEDFELRGFLPLLPAQLILDYSRKQSFGSDGGNKDKNARVERIIAAGKSLINIVRIGQQGIYFDPKLKKFSIGVDPQMANDFAFSGSFEVLAVNGAGQEHPEEKNMNSKTLQQKPQLYLEGEEEDEEIVFKPSAADKFVDVIAPKVTSHEAFGTGVDACKVDLGSPIASVSAPYDGIYLQNGSRPLTTLADGFHQHLQTLQPTTSKWLVEQQTSITNGLNGLSFMENGLSMNTELQESLGGLRAATPSLPFPQSVNISAHNIYPGQVPETVIPSKFDSIMLSGASSDGLSMKPSSASSAISRKNPVSRPVRHSGPPPGFSPVPPKNVEEPFSGLNLKNENLVVDDYSWLDGYQLPSSTQGIGFSHSINHSAQAYQNGSKINSLNGTQNFPFPGKQVPTFQVQMENQKSWQNYHFPENLQLQLQKGNQQSIAPPEQHQGQSLWGGQFFV